MSEGGLSRASKKRLRKKSKDQDSVSKFQKNDDLSKYSTSNDTQKLSHQPKPPQHTDLDLAGLTVDSVLSLDEVTQITSKERASVLFSNIIHPQVASNFYQEYWEKKYLVINRNHTNQYEGLFSLRDLNVILSSRALNYESEVLVRKYDHDLIKSFSIGDPSKQVKKKDLDKYLDDGYTIRLLCPQKYNDMIWRYLSALEHEFDSALLCHVVHTPSNRSEYFPQILYVNHFILQLEDSSIWELYRATDGNILPIIPIVDSEQSLSTNVNTSDEIHNGSRKEIPPTATIELHPGDSLYIPRGWKAAHKATYTSPSLHLAIHFYRTTTYSDLISMILPIAMTSATEESPSLRKSLPTDFLSFSGVAKSEEDESDDRRLKFQSNLKGQFKIIAEKVAELVDAAGDQLAKKFISERLPVPLTEVEESLVGTGSGLSEHSINLYSSLRMVRPGVARAVVEDGMVVVYHCMDNARELFGNDLSPLEFELDDGPAIEMLLAAYPEGVTVSDLQHSSEDEDDKLSVARALFKEGFLILCDAISKPVDDDKCKDEATDSIF